MQNPIDPDQAFTEQDLAALDRFLSHDAPPESMGLDELHGFLAAVISAPQLVMPSQWMSHVWGGAEPDFASMEQAQEVMGQIMRLNNDVALFLSAGDFDPLFMEETLIDGEVLLAPCGWCEGYVQGMQLQPDAWTDAELNNLLMPIIILSDTLDDPKVEAMLDDQDNVDKLAEAIPEAAVAIYRYQRQQLDGVSQPIRKSEKVGRNDPCPCGSGKKYKKCCGAQRLH